MSFILRFLRWLLFRERRVLLFAESPLVIRTVRGAPASRLVVRAAHADGVGDAPAHVAVSFEVRRGHLTIGSEGARAVTVRTDASGRARIDVVLGGTGQALLAATVEGVRERLLFRVRGEGVTDRLSSYGDSVFTASAGEVVATVVAVDHRGQPVDDATLHASLTRPISQVVRATVTAEGNGVYRVVARTRDAGDWRLRVEDRTTGVHVERCVHILPSDPQRIEVDETSPPDPRHEPPYDEVTLRARLVDAYGNALDPARLTAMLEGQLIRGVAVGAFAEFTVRRVGHQLPLVRIVDGTSGLEQERELHFAAAWMAGRGVARPGSTFATPVFFQPPPDRAVTSATIEVQIDRERADYLGLIDVATVAVVEQALEADRLILGVSFSKPITADAYPTGLQLCTIDWACTSPGQTCFAISASMSPSTPGWRLCMEQKHEIPNRRCVCVNVIYRASHPDDRVTGREMARSALNAIARNDYYCCPDMWAVFHECSISDQQWRELGDEWLTDDPQDPDDLDYMYGTGICQREDCLNVYALTIDSSSLKGYTSGSGNTCATIDLTTFRTGEVNNLAAHEFGHMFGLEHRRQPGNIMSPGDAPWQPGNYLGTDQCRQIWEALEDYPC